MLFYEILNSKVCRQSNVLFDRSHTVSYQSSTVTIFPLNILLISEAEELAKVIVVIIFVGDVCGIFRDIGPGS